MPQASTCRRKRQDITVACFLVRERPSHLEEVVSRQPVTTDMREQAHPLAHSCIGEPLVPPPGPDCAVAESVVEDPLAAVPKMCPHAPRQLQV